MTPEALGALTHDPSTLISSALLHSDVSTRIADDNFSKLDAILDEIVWVLEADVKQWLAGQVVRWTSQRAG